jgi:glutamate--cysteine ligase
LHERHRDSYVDFALARSLRHRADLLSLPLPDDAAARLAGMADESLAQQRALEASDTAPFEEYRQRYLALDVMSGMREAPSAND